MKKNDTTSTWAAMQSKQGVKVAKMYNAYNEIIYSITVTGTFNYNGVYSKATAVSYTHYEDTSLYTFVSATKSYYDNFATATGKFEAVSSGTIRSLTVTVGCAEDGTIY